MAPVRTTCPFCDEVTHLAPAEIFLALNDPSQAAGDYAYTCPQCERIGVHTADDITVARLLSAGVIPLAAAMAPPPVAQASRQRAADD